MTSVTLALKELRHEWRASLCFAASLVSILAPLLILLALKNGVLDTMVEGLVDDPRNREILSTRASSLDSTFFSSWAQDKEVQFISPRTRAVNTQVKALQNSATRKVAQPVTLIPSAPGDPLIDGPTVTAGSVYLTERLADQIEWAEGQKVIVIVERTLNGTLETARAELSVLGIVRQSVLRQRAMFVSLELLLAVERFIDDRATSPELWLKDIAQPETYSSFRLYVNDLSALEDVNSRLQKQGLSTRPFAQNAVSLLDFKTRLNGLYIVISALAVLGFWAAMAANLRGMVERQRNVFSFLNLIGFSSWMRAGIPAAQSMILIAAGIGISFCVVFPMIMVVNTVLENGTATLSLTDVGFTIALGAILAATSSIWAVRAAVQVSASEVLRNA